MLGRGIVSSPSDPAAPSGPGVLSRFFAFVIAKRWLIVAFYALLLPPSIFYAIKVGQDNDIQKLMVPSDPDFVNTTAFQDVFGAGEFAILLAEADDPFAPGVIERVDKLEKALAKIERVKPSSALSAYSAFHAGFSGTPAEIAGFKKFVTGTDLIKKQGLAGDHFLAVALVLDVKKGADRNADRNQLLAAVDKAVDEAGGGSPPLRKLRRAGQPYVNAYLDDSTREGGKYFGLFAVFVVVLNLALYRSGRALVLFLITLGVCMAMSVGYIGLTGGTFTIVSPMVPMTILVTATATLVYLHSRFVDCPPGRDVEEHRIFSLTNKFVACTASIFATLVGFAALAVSEIRPIREMGLWVAVGLFITWIIVLTLFPALQRILRAPTAQESKVAGEWFIHFTHWLPRASYRARIVLVLSAIGLMGLGGVALFGLPGGAVDPMKLLVDPVEYVNHDTDLFKDTKFVQRELPGLSITEVWLKGGLQWFVEPEGMKGMAEFQAAMEADPEVGAVVSPISILRMVRYGFNEGDKLPTDIDSLGELGGQLDGFAKQQPLLQSFVTPDLAQTHFSVITRVTEHEAFLRLDARIRERWQKVVKDNPKLAPVEMKTVGLGPLQAKMSQNLVPTLVESFVLTVAIIFMTFVVVFRSGAARLMTMIPSLFAILVMFGVMRLGGMRLNVATILIASTVLGTSENDQIHFFYHFLEKRKTGTVEEALRHTLLVSGKAIFFATLINAGGFVAFAISPLPPIRQFGALSAVALAMSMIADFTALPAALWLVFREKPDSPREAAAPPPAG